MAKHAAAAERARTQSMSGSAFSGVGVTWLQKRRCKVPGRPLLVLMLAGIRPEFDVAGVELGAGLGEGVLVVDKLMGAGDEEKVREVPSRQSRCVPTLDQQIR